MMITSNNNRHLIEIRCVFTGDASSHNISNMGDTFAHAQFISGSACLRDTGCYAVGAPGYQRPPIMHHCEETLANNNLAKTELRM